MTSIRPNHIFELACRLGFYSGLPRPAGQTWIDVETCGESAAAESGVLIRMAPPEVAKLRRLVEMQVVERWKREVEARGIDGGRLIQDARALVDKYTE